MSICEVYFLSMCAIATCAGLSILKYEYTGHRSYLVILGFACGVAFTISV